MCFIKTDLQLGVLAVDSRWLGGVICHARVNARAAD